VFVPALLTGNAVLYKPSEVATLTGLAIADLLHEAGVPKPIFIPVVGAGLTGAALLEQPIDGVFFTGSYATGQKIAVAAAPKLIRTHLELGGKTWPMSPLPLERPWPFWPGGHPVPGWDWYVSSPPSLAFEEGWWGGGVMGCRRGAASRRVGVVG